MAYEDWLVTTATIDGCDWEGPPSQSAGSIFVGRFKVAFSYAVGGNHYRGSFDSSHAWEKETELGLLCNPENPMECTVCDEEEPRLIQILECVFGSLDLS